jgi:hypothetical protein
MTWTSALPEIATMAEPEVVGPLLSESEEEPATSWFELRLVAGPKDAGLGGISLSVQTPDGATRSATANAGGILRLDGVKRGACEVLSDLRDARIENFAALCGASDSKRAQKSGQSTDLSGVEHLSGGDGAPRAHWRDSVSR